MTAVIRRGLGAALLALILASSACTTANNRVAPTPVPTNTGTFDVSRLWSMAPRAGTVTNGRVTEDAGDVPSYPVSPASYTIRLNAQPLLTQFPQVIGFAWKLDGRLVSNRAIGTAATTLGPHTLSLEISGSNGFIATDTKSIVAADRLIVSAGDSIASGEGNPDMPGTGGTGFEWEDPRCDRSGHAYGAQAAETLQQQDPQVSVTYVSVACSGAATGESPAGQLKCTTSGFIFVTGTCDQTGSDGILRPYAGINPPSSSAPDLPAQIDQVKSLVGSRRIDDLVLTIGGNDVGFSDIATDCASLATACNQDTGIVNNLASDLNLLGRPGGGYDQVAHAINTELSVARVWITTIYDPTTNTNGSTCGDDTILHDVGEYSPGLAGTPVELVGGRVSTAEASWVSRDLIAPLNAQILAAAARNGWNVIGSPTNGGTFQQLFSGHGYCAADPWVVRGADSAQFEGPGLAGAGTQNTKGTLHPNAEGTAAYASATANRLGTGGPRLTLANGSPVAADCTGSAGWISGHRAIGAAGCSPEVLYTVTAENPPPPGSAVETSGLYTAGLRMPEEGPQLSVDGTPVAFDTNNATTWTCESTQVSCEVDLPATAAGALPTSATFYLTLTTEGVHTFNLSIGNGLGVTSDVGWVAQADWTPPVTTATLVGSQVHLTATDDYSGVAGIVYQINGGSKVNASASGSTVAIHDGDTITYGSTDVAGNIEAARTAKVVNGSLIPQP